MTGALPLSRPWEYRAVNAESRDIAGPVAAQVAAYNSHDIEAFVACFHEDAVVTGPDGAIQMQGVDELRERYGEMFEAMDTTAEIVHRLRVGDWVVDQERVHRGGEVLLEALVAYQVNGDRIQRMIVFR